MSSKQSAPNNPGQPQQASPPPVAAVVSQSPLMRKRLAADLSAAGFETAPFDGVGSFSKHPRQRPFVLAFVDVRGKNGGRTAAACRKARPGERYVVIRAAFETHAKNRGNGGFGTLCEAFTDEEILVLTTRAVEEERKAEAAPSLEDLLYERFRDFLSQIGPSSVKDLHKLVSERVERPLFEAVMEWARGNQTKAADVLGIHRNTLRAKLKTLGVSSRLGREGAE